MELKRSYLLMFRVVIFGLILTDLCEGDNKPYKRMSNILHHFTLNSLSPTHISNLMQKTISRSRERRGRVVSDAGYGSRVSAGSNIANAVMARHSLFGIHGPGRRKRQTMEALFDILHRKPNYLLRR